MAPLPCMAPQDPHPEELRKLGRGALVVESHKMGHTLLGGAFYISGAIPRVTPYEAGLPGHASLWVSEFVWSLVP